MEKAIGKNSTTYSLITIDKNGEVQPLSKYIPELQQRDSAGNNPTSDKYQVRSDGAVEKGKILSEYKIGNKIIELDNKEMGRVEMNIGEEAHGSNETTSVQVRDSNTIEIPSTQTRATVGKYESNGEYTVDENLKEAKMHEKNGDCDKMTKEDIDGDPNTKSHMHDENINFNELAVKWGYYINGRPDSEKAKAVFEKTANNNLDKSQEEVIEIVSEELENDYRSMNDIS